MLVVRALKTCCAQLVPCFYVWKTQAESMAVSIHSAPKLAEPSPVCCIGIPSKDLQTCEFVETGLTSVPTLAVLRSSQAEGSSTTRTSSGFSRGGAARRCETWIVLELCSLGSLQVRHAPLSSALLSLTACHRKRARHG